MKRYILFVSLIISLLTILAGCQNGSRLTAKQEKEMEGPAPAMPEVAIKKFEQEHASSNTIPPSKLKSR